MNKHEGFTIIEILVGLSVTAAIFVITTTLVVNVFSSTTKGKRVEAIEQTKNDLWNEFANNGKWARNISFVNGVLTFDQAEYVSDQGKIYKNGQPITSGEVNVTRFEVIKHTPPAIAGSMEKGIGLEAKYYNNADLTELVTSQLDFEVDFDWGGGSPHPEIDSDTFSVQWQGQIEIPGTGNYTFYTRVDDGARLFIGGEQLIDRWRTGGRREFRGSSELEGGKRYDLILSYFERRRNASISLLWSGPGISKQVIPTERLYPSVNASSIEIIIDMNYRGSGSIFDTLKLTLYPRNGVIGSILPAPTPTPTPTPTLPPTPPPSLTPTPSASPTTSPTPSATSLSTPRPPRTPTPTPSPTPKPLR